MQEVADKAAPTGKSLALAAERRQALVAQLASDGRIVSRQLAQAWGVSEDTIRRDIRELHDAGLLQRTHGGALPRTSPSVPYVVRAASSIDIKAKLGRHAAAFIADGATALLYGGTTVLEVARALPAGLRARIITNDPHIALEAARRERIETLLVGGRLLATSQCTVGSGAIELVRSLRADVCFIGACALHDDFGLTTNDVDEADLARAFVQASAEIVALVLPEALQTAAPFRVAPAAAITRLVSAADADAHALDCFARMGVAVDVAP